MRTLLILAGLALLCACGSAPPPGGLTERQVRAFTALEERLWAAHDVKGFYALYLPEARFEDNVGNAQSVETLQQARAQSEAFFRRHPEASEDDLTVHIEIAPDGQSAEVLGRETLHFLRDGQPVTLHDDVIESLVLRNGRVWSIGQTTWRS